MEMNGAHQTSANLKAYTHADTFHSLIYQFMKLNNHQTYKQTVSQSIQSVYYCILMPNGDGDGVELSQPASQLVLVSEWVALRHFILFWDKFDNFCFCCFSSGYKNKLRFNKLCIWPRAAITTLTKYDSNNSFVCETKTRFWKSNKNKPYEFVFFFTWGGGFWNINMSSMMIWWLVGVFIMWWL